MDDLIDRQKAIKDAESWVAVDEYEKHLQKKVVEWLKEFPSAELVTNLAEVGTDCISRKQAIDDIWTVSPLACLERKWVDRWLRQLPPIQPKRGRWIKLDMHRGMADHKCTACERECYVPTCMGEPMYAFCPNCGAKMEVNHESN